MTTILNDITEAVGHTPLVRLQRLGKGLPAFVLVKVEAMNPLGSIKDRTALSMVRAAERDGLIGPGSTLVEPTSGNTGVGLAFVCAVAGYKLILTMPDNASPERKQLFASLGAKSVLTPASEGMQGAIRVAEEIHAKTPNSFIPFQFGNLANPRVHRETTGPEIWADTDGLVDIVIACVGTGGTVTGVAQALKPLKPELQMIALEPTRSPVLSGGKPGPHKIAGMGAGFVPDVLQLELIDEILQVTDEDAMHMTRQLALQEGILAGISSGAAVAAALTVAARPANQNKLIVAILPDTGQRYMSTGLFEAED